MISVKELPILSFDTIARMEDMSWFTDAKIFDDLIIVSQKETCCYIWKTGIGLVIFDAIWPDERAYYSIMDAIEKAGWTSEKIVALFMTHGHIDHVGCGKWLVDHCNLKTYLSSKDDALRLGTPDEPNRSGSWKEFSISRYIKDGDILAFGDKQVHVVATPAHTEGCMSFIFPVTDNCEKHMAGLFGGATAPWNNPEGRAVQLQSVEKFKSAMHAYGVDVALTNHTAFDNGLEKIAYSRKRMAHLPNIYILGEEGAQKFCDVYRRVAEE